MGGQSKVVVKSIANGFPTLSMVNHRLPNAEISLDLEKMNQETAASALRRGSPTSVAERAPSVRWHEDTEEASIPTYLHDQGPEHRDAR